MIETTAPTTDELISLEMLPEPIRGYCAICSAHIPASAERYMTRLEPGDLIDAELCWECADPDGLSIPADVRAMK